MQFSPISLQNGLKMCAFLRGTINWLQPVQTNSVACGFLLPNSPNCNWQVRLHAVRSSPVAVFLQLPQLDLQTLGLGQQLTWHNRGTIVHNIVSINDLDPDYVRINIPLERWDQHWAPTCLVDTSKSLWLSTSSWRGPIVQWGNLCWWISCAYGTKSGIVSMLH